MNTWSTIGGIPFYPGWSENGKARSTSRCCCRSARRSASPLQQVMLRWHLQQGRSAIPKSVKSSRIAENFDIFDFNDQ